MMQILKACPLGRKGTPVVMTGQKAPKGAVVVDPLRHKAAIDAGWIGEPTKPKKKGGAE